MENYSTKFRHIVPSFLVVVFGTTIVTLAFRWVFTINSEILPIKEDVFHIWLPIILPWVPISIWLRPKLRILKFKKEGSDAPLLFQVITWVTMMAMMIVSNAYLKTASGSLKVINTIDQLIEHDARYVSIQEVELDRLYGSAHTEFRASGKHNQYLNFDSYFVYPFREPGQDSVQYWYGVKFQEQISNRIEPEEKEEKYKAFFEQAVKDFESYDFNEANYLEILPHSDDRQGFLKAVERISEFAHTKPVILEPQEGSYETRNGKKFEWIFGSFGIGFSLFLFVLIFPQFVEKEHERQLKGIKPKSDDLVDMLKYLIPKGEHFVTSIILDINIVVFLVMVFSGIHLISPNGLELLEWGANRRSETSGGDWWRLVSSMFLHGGIMHLFLNVYGLVLAAIFVEPIFGRTRYFVLYFISGICGSLASIYWYENTISVGASGAIFGLYGSILGLLLTNEFEGEKRVILLLVGPYVGINLLFGLTGGIDNAAHMGGLIAGAVSGLILYHIGKETQANRD